MNVSCFCMYMHACVHRHIHTHMHTQVRIFHKWWHYTQCSKLCFLHLTHLQGFFHISIERSHYFQQILNFSQLVFKLVTASSKHEHQNNLNRIQLMFHLIFTQFPKSIINFQKDWASAGNRKGERKSRGTVVRFWGT